MYGVLHRAQKKYSLLLAVLVIGEYSLGLDMHVLSGLVDVWSIVVSILMTEPSPNFSCAAYVPEVLEREIGTANHPSMPLPVPRIPTFTTYIHEPIL